MKLIPAFFQAIYVSYNSLPVSDQIQLLGIIASLVVSIVAIVIFSCNFASELQNVRICF